MQDDKMMGMTLSYGGTLPIQHLEDYSTDASHVPPTVYNCLMGRRFSETLFDMTLGTTSTNSGCSRVSTSTKSVESHLFTR